MARKKVKKKKVVQAAGKCPGDEYPVDKGPGFEESLARLEEIAAELEDGSIALEVALDRYEEGVGLLRRCGGLLSGAQRRIELLSGFDADGNPVTAPLDDDTLSLEEKAQRRSRRRTAVADSKQADATPNSGRDTTADGPSDMDESGRLF